LTLIWPLKRFNHTRNTMKGCVSVVRLVWQVSFYHWIMVAILSFFAAILLLNVILTFNPKSDVNNGLVISKIPWKMCHSYFPSMFSHFSFFIISNGGHLGFMQIMQFAQGCQSGNKVYFDLGPHTNTKQRKKFIRITISRFIKYQID